MPRKHSRLARNRRSDPISRSVWSAAHSAAVIGLLMVALQLFVPRSVIAQKQIESSVKTYDSAEGAREAQKLLSEIFAQRPKQTFTNATLRIRDRDGDERKVLVRFRTSITPGDWSATYSVEPSQVKSGVVKATITHSDRRPNTYEIVEAGSAGVKSIPPEETNIRFANSDFSLIDLGLEFLHWPQQRITKKEMYSSRYCAILESTNPHPVKGGYARVRAWITVEPPLAPVRAEAYDENGKRIKVFDVKGVERVNGHFQVDSVEMRDLQRGSRTIMEFDLGR